MPQTQWGNWSLNTGNACLEYPGQLPDMPLYQIPVDEMTNSASILDWIFQVQEKTWASSSDVGDLVGAIESILGRGVAGGGVDRPIDPKVALSRKYGIVFP